jgi:hexosaminidase
MDNNIAYISANLLGTIKNPPVTNIKLNYNKATGKKVTLKNQPSNKYPGDGAFTLVNGIEATVNPNWSSAEWLGFNGIDLELIIDLGKIDTINKVTVGFLFDKLSWIYPPQSMQILISNSGRNYDDAGTVLINSDLKRIPVAMLPTIKTGRYIKIVAKNYGLIPPHNPGAGSKPWLFVDEIAID